MPDDREHASSWGQASSLITNLGNGLEDMRQSVAAQSLAMRANLEALIAARQAIDAQINSAYAQMASTETQVATFATMTDAARSLRSRFRQEDERQAEELARADRELYEVPRFVPFGNVADEYTHDYEEHDGDASGVESE